MSRLVVLYADLDAQYFVTELLRRGIERRCMAAPEAVHVRDTQGDSGVAKDPLETLCPVLQRGDYVLALWDHHGSGWENRAPEQVEEEVCRKISAIVPRERVEAIAFVPELEAALAPVWERTLTLLAAGGRPNPAGPVPFDRAHPREKSWIPAVRATKQRLGAEHFRRVAAGLSLPALKSEPASPLHRISQALQTWFPKATEQ